MTREEWATKAVQDFVRRFPDKGVTIICHQETEGNDRVLVCISTSMDLRRREIDLHRVLKEFPESREVIDVETGDVIEEDEEEKQVLTHLGNRRRDS